MPKNNKKIAKIISPKIEVVLGIVSQLGSDRKAFIDLLKQHLDVLDIEFEKIKITDQFIKIRAQKKDENLSESFETFMKMQICSQLRLDYSNAILMKWVIDAIKRKRVNHAGKVVLYVIDQLKHEDEYHLLSHVYGLNYIQVSLFSHEAIRDSNIKAKFKCDVNKKSNLINHMKNFSIVNTTITEEYADKFFNKWITEYNSEVLRDAAHQLLEKDFKDNDKKFSDAGTGQRISKLFHLSHYFFNLDNLVDDLDREITKFVNLLIGENRDYPTQDEFGMCIAYQASVRSNFPNLTHIGASIISDGGEVLSVGSIRAPSPSANTTIHDENKISDGYRFYKNKLKDWDDFLAKNIKNKNNKMLDEVRKYIADSLDFHPCTHAEIAALLDAAKIGISVYKATMYTTTFPCHLCAKDIVSSGIRRVVYLEAYPKSKNKELYPYNISIDCRKQSDGEKVPFCFYSGVGPKRYYHVYSLDNKRKVSSENIKKIKIPMLALEHPKYYDEKEKDVKGHLNVCLRNGECKTENSLCDLLKCNSVGRQYKKKKKTESK